jgi:hypothetical protein
VSPDTRRQRPARGKSLIPDRPLRNPARIIHVVAEGQVTEPDYCTALNKYFKDKHEFQINTSYSGSKGLHPLEVAERAISAATKSGREGDGPPHEVWALFDRDQHPDVREAFARLYKHNAAAAENKHKEVGIAFSHPSFDLWLLLHFQSLTTPQDGSSDQVHEKLRGYPAFEQFAARTSGSKSISEARAAQLLPRTEAAVRNARTLIKLCPGSGCSPNAGHAADCDPLRRDPSTDVWRLIQSLGIVAAYGRKSL